MITALMVGGPAHGKSWRLQEPLGDTWHVPRASDPAAFMQMPGAHELDLPPRDHVYTLFWYRLRPEEDAERYPGYVCLDRPSRTEPPVTRQDWRDWRLADVLWGQAHEARLPDCVVPGCTDKARATFTAAEPGVLAKRLWKPGDKITLCSKHGYDVYAAQGETGWDGLAPWLREDATWDPVKAAEAGSVAMLARAARSLRVSQDVQSR